MIKIKLSRETSQKRIFFWNAAGSGFNALSTVVLLMITTRVLGEVQGGIVTIGLALAQQMLTISNFETGTYYVTDGKGKFGFDIHLAAKIILFAISMIAAIVVSVYSYDPYKAAVVTALCVYKGTDGFSVLFSGGLQREGRLDVAGISLCLKIIISTIAFFAVAIIGHDLLAASIAAAVVALAWIFLVESACVANFIQIKAKFNIKQVLALIVECLPMFLGTFLLTYIANQPKYVIDSLLSEEIQNAFGIVFMPSAVICMLSLFIYRPLLNILTDLWAQSKLKAFIGSIVKITGLLFAITCVCVAGAALIGIPVLSAVFGVDLEGLRLALCLILVGGGLYAASTLLYNVIVILRKQTVMLAAYFVAYVFSLIVTKPLVVAYGLNGAAGSYLLANLVLCVILVAVSVFFFIKKAKEKV